jgi:hypothetical protein
MALFMERDNSLPRCEERRSGADKVGMIGTPTARTNAAPFRIMIKPIHVAHPNHSILVKMDRISEQTCEKELRRSMSV